MKKILLLISILLLITPLTQAITLDVLTTNPAPVQAGEFADITVEIESATTESTYTDLQISLKETNYLSVISMTSGQFDTLRPGRVATFTFRVYVDDTLPQGFIDLDFTGKAKSLDQEFKERIFVQSAETAPELSIGSIKTTPNKLLPDTDDNVILVTLQNLGDKDAELVTATLKQADGMQSAYSYSLRDSVSSIPSGEQVTLEFTTDILENIQEHIPTVLNLQYRSEQSDTYKTYTVSLPLDLELVPAPYLEITNVEQENSFQGGTTENDVVVTLTNNGPVEAEEVRIRIIPDISYPFIFDATTQYVSSTIKPGESARAVFTAEVTEDAMNANYSLTAKLESLVGSARYTREDTMQLATKQGESIANSTVAYIVIGIVIALAVFIGIQARKRKGPKR